MNQTRDEQTAKIYASIGQYVVEYSQLMHSLKGTLTLTLAEIPSRQPAISDLLEELSDQAFIRVIRRHLRAPPYRSADDHKIIDEIVGRIGQAEAERNQLLHSVWFVGWGTEETTDWSKADRLKYSARRKKVGAVDSHNEMKHRLPRGSASCPNSELMRCGLP